MTAAALALLSAALAAIDGTAVAVQAGARAESSAVAFSAGGAAPVTLGAVDLLPRAGLLLDHRTLRLALSYEPQLRATQGLSATRSDAALLHGGSLRAEWDLHPLWSGTLAAHATERLLDFVAATATELARVMDTREPPAPVRTSDAGISLALVGRPTRRLTFSSSASLDASGGLAPAGRTALPPLRELRLAARLERAQTRRDALALEVGARSARFEAAAPAAFARGALAWIHDASATLRLRLVAGAAWTLAGAAPAGFVPDALAQVEATPALLDRPLRAALTVRAEPAFDRFEGRIVERLSLEGALAWEPAPRWTVAALALAGRVRESRGYLASRADLRTAWRATPRITLFAHAWNEWHRDPRLAAGATATYLGTGLGVEIATDAR